MESARVAEDNENFINIGSFRVDTLPSFIEQSTILF